MKHMVCLAMALSFGLVLALAPTRAHALPELVFRATSSLDEPKTVKSIGGFVPRGADGTRPNQPPPNISLYNHAHGAATGMSRNDSGYVATTARRSIAFDFLRLYLVNTGYIYHIRPSRNFYDVNGILLQFSPHATEAEFAALGTIQWDQIIGWEEINFGVSAGFIANPDFRPQLYGPLVNEAGVNYELAGFPLNHPAWRQQPWRTVDLCNIPPASPLGTCSIATDTAQWFGERAFHRNYPKKIVWLDDDL